MSFRHDAALKVRERNDVFVKTTETEQRLCAGYPSSIDDWWGAVFDVLYHRTQGNFSIFSEINRGLRIKWNHFRHIEHILHCILRPGWCKIIMKSLALRIIFLIHQKVDICKVLCVEDPYLCLNFLKLYLLLWKHDVNMITKLFYWTVEAFCALLESAVLIYFVGVLDTSCALIDLFIDG